MLSLKVFNEGSFMLATIQPFQPLSELEYLALEQQSTVRHEWIEGQMVAMAGSSKQHNTIAGNIFTHCHITLRNTPCRPYSSDIKVRALSNRNYYYPDIVVGCESDESNDYYLEKPCLIVEVLSESTEKRDRTEKLIAYLNIPSLKAYVLVAQDKPEVDCFYRDEQGIWQVKLLTGLEAVLELPCVSTPISLADIYTNVLQAD